MRKSDRIVNGYRLVYLPDHQSAMTGGNWDGYVYEHKYVAEQQLGRVLCDNECVHHLDGNKLNNLSTNLLVLLKSEHGKLHSWLDRCVFNGKPLNVNRMNSGNSEVPCCRVCGLTLQKDQDIYCSRECYSLVVTSKNKPNKGELELAMAEERSWLALGRRYGVSDNTVRKWAKQYGITTILSQAKGKPLEGAETSGGVEEIQNPLNNHNSVRHLSSIEE